MTADPAAERVRSRAFGLDLTANFSAPALPPAQGPEGPRAVSLDLTDALAPEWDDGRAQQVGQLPAPPAEPTVRLHIHPELGWRFTPAERGAFTVSADGARIDCVQRPTTPAAAWQRFLVAQVLPLAAILQGLEVLHASAVVLDGGAVAFVGPPASGKSSVATRLHLRGAEWMADDVVALDITEQGLLAHPGSAVAGLRHAEAARLDPGARDRLGPVVGENAKEVLYALPRREDPLPLRAVVALETAVAESSTFEAVGQPTLLLGSVYAPLVSVPERLQRALDIAHALLGAVPVLRARVARNVDAAEFAESVERELAEHPAVVAR